MRCKADGVRQSQAQDERYQIDVDEKRSRDMPEENS